MATQFSPNLLLPRPQLVDGPVDLPQLFSDRDAILDTLVKAKSHGSSIIATSQTRTNTVYGTLTTPDQVTGLVLPADGLIRVLYQATWQESVSSAASAAIFLGNNQVQIAGANAPAVQTVFIGGPSAKNVPLFTTGGGLNSTISSTGYTGDVTTGQILPGSTYLFAAAGTYTVSIQFKSTSGSVTASNRRLYCYVV